MLPLFEMLEKANQGNGIDAMARQMGVTPDQAKVAMEALLPAFSEGLKRNTNDPAGVGSFLNALASGRHQSFFDDPGQAFSQSGRNEGNGILGHLFGSPDVSRAIADQAATATGLNAQTLKQMLPALATMIMGGLYEQSTGKMQAGQFNAGGNVIGEVIEQMMRQQAGRSAPQAPAPQPPASPSGPQGNPFDNPFGKILEGMFGGQPGSGRSGQQGGSAGNNPLGKIFEDMLRGGQAGEPQQKRAPEPTRRANPRNNPWAEPAQPEREQPSSTPANPYDEIFGRMFETGRQSRDEYQKSVESIFDQYKRGMDRRR